MAYDVVLFHGVGHPLSLQSRPLPQPGEGEVLVRVLASGICDTDARFVRLGIPWMREPLVLGHQIAGMVEKVGSGVTSLKKGDHVIIHFVIGCGRCLFCQRGEENLCPEWKGVGAHVDGGFAQYVLVPEKNAIPISDTLSPEEASLIPCGLGTPYRALVQAGVRAGEVVLIQRAWVWGLAAVSLCHLMGARAVVLDDDAERLRYAREHKAEAALDPRSEDVREALAPWAPFGADVLLDFTGDPEWIARGLTWLRRGGRAVIVGRAGCAGELKLDIPTLMFTEASIRGAWLTRQAEVRQLAAWVEEGRLTLSPLLGHRIRLEEINEGIALLDHPDTLGVVIVP
ncbi:putative zinc-type alcohol dehydrogenase-like protein YjmD [bacterium HR10]|nr:putative zinc-type alcohol dehydrogenase-like protein YjmD [bacterium HR10]